MFEPASLGLLKSKYFYSLTSPSSSLCRAGKYRPDCGYWQKYGYWNPDTPNKILLLTSLLGDTSSICEESRQIGLEEIPTHRLGKTWEKFHICLKWHF